MEIETVITAAADNPFRFACVKRKPEVRRALTKRFPYRLFFIRRRDAVVVFRVLHTARGDQEWTSHTPSS